MGESSTSHTHTHTYTHTHTHTHTEWYHAFALSPSSRYAPYFATASDKLVGTKLPGIKKACLEAIRAHELSPFPWLKTVGWDGMFLRKGGFVFFEGNFGSIRIPRRIFLAPGTLFTFLKEHAWPWAAARPSIQARLVDGQEDEEKGKAGKGGKAGRRPRTESESTAPAPRWGADGTSYGGEAERNGCRTS